jgi:hypothetical protein
MSRIAAAVAAVLAVVVWAVPAVAEEVRVEYRQETVIDYGEVGLEGEIQRPEGSLITERRRARFDSLIRLRGDFYPELAVSTDDL